MDPSNSLEIRMLKMAGAPSILSGISSTSTSKRRTRRAACDRCRHQKLKCTSEDKHGNPTESGKCIRCTNQGVPCSFSISKRTGRPPNPRSSDNASPTEPKAKLISGKTRLTASAREGPGQKDCRQDEFYNDLNDDWIRSRCVVGHGGGTQMGASQYADGMSTEETEPKLLMSTFGEESNCLQPPLNNSLLDSRHLASSEAARLPNFFAFSTAEEYSSSFMEQDFGAYMNSELGEQMMQLDRFNIGSNFPFSQASSAMAMDFKMTTAPHVSNEGKSDPGQGKNMGMTDSLCPSICKLSNPYRVLESSPSSLEASKFFSSASRSSSRSLDSQADNRAAGKKESNPINFDSSATPPSPSHQSNEAEKKRSPGVNQCASSSSNDAQQQLMQHLSELDMRLHSELMNLNTQSQDDNSDSAALFNQFVGSTFQSSATFLNILKSFYPTAACASSAEPPLASTNPTSIIIHPNSRSPSDMSNFSDAAPRLTNKVDTDLQASAANAMATKRPYNKLIRSAPSETTKSLPSNVDMATVLQLLRCYIRIIHLHSIFYSKFSAYLAALPPGPYQPPPVFPGIRVGGVPLDDFGTFQMKLLLQISTHILGEIEMALGLPDGYRISKKNAGVCGILEKSVSVAFIEMTMRESERTTGFGVESDRTASIRRDLAWLRLRLKGTINIWFGLDFTRSDSKGISRFFTDSRSVINWGLGS